MKKHVVINVIITGEERVIRQIQKTIRERHSNLSVEVVPTLQFRRCKLTSEIQTTLSNIQSFDYIFFSSSRAVRFFVELLKELGIVKKNIPPAVVVGPMTKEACEKVGIKVISQPKIYTAKAMVDEFQELVGSQILFPRSTIAPEDTLASINNSGAKVRELSLYETVYRTDILSEAEQDALLNAEIVMFLSPSSVHSFVKLLDNSTLTSNLSSMVALCIGPRTERTAKEYGFKTITAQVHTIKGLLATLGEAI